MFIKVDIARPRVKANLAAITFLDVVEAIAANNKTRLTIFVFFDS